MATIIPIAKHAPTERFGLAYWMARVLKECDRAEKRFDAEAVHDLRVALRRCRSMADGMMQVDTRGGWRKMKRSARTVFRTLGALRDTQVMMEWIAKLAPAENLAGQRVLMILAERERTGKAEARQALERFDRKNWRRWAQRLPQRAREMPFDGLIFQQVALDRWKKARELDRRARRSPSRVAWHRLRIGIKRFRYMVENFLPSRHAEWGEDLKHMQDLLGDVHDLDVLRSELLALGKLLDENERTQWEEWIERERKLRLTEYRSRTRGEDSLWTRWRRGLLGGEAPAARPESEEPSGEEAKQVVPSAG